MRDVEAAEAAEAVTEMEPVSEAKDQRRHSRDDSSEESDVPDKRQRIASTLERPLGMRPLSQGKVLSAVSFVPPQVRSQGRIANVVTDEISNRAFK